MTEGNDNRGGGPRGRTGGGAGRGGSRGDRPGGGFRGARPGGDRPREGGFRGPRREDGDRPPREGGFRGPRRENGDRPQREGGFRGPRREDGDRPQREGGFRGPRREDGDRPQREGGFRGPRREDGDRPPREGGFRGPRRENGERPQREGGFRGPRREDGDRPQREGGFRGPRREDGDRPQREGGFRGPRREDGDRPQREGGFRGPRREDGDRPQRAPRENRGDDGAPRPERPFREDKRGRNHFREGAQRPPKREEREGPARRLPTVEVRGGGRQGGQQQEATHWIYGRHAVLAALANPRRQIQRLIATPQFIEETPLGQHNLLETMSRTDMDAVLARYDREGASHGGIAAYASTLNPPSTEALLKGEGPAIVVVLDQVSDPHNTGAILRTAAAFGARAVIAPERNAAPVTGSLAKAASGALETVPYLRPTNLARTLAMLKEWGYWRIGLDGAATHNIAEARKFDRIALVLGSEGKGLRRLTAENCDMLVSIPISEAVESLNVSNATAIALYALKS